MNRSDVLWSGILAAGGFLLGLVLLCIAPFVAVATLAARTLPLRVALAVLGVMWLGGQLAGFAFFHYPHALSTYALGVAILLAAFAAATVAARVRLAPLGFVAAFVVFEGVQYAFALVFGGRDGFAPAIVAEIFEGNLLGLAILWSLRLVANAAGVSTPALRASAQRDRGLPRGL